MDHAVNVRMGLEDLVKILFLPDVHLHELWTLAGYQFDALQDLLAGVIEIVADHDLVASFQEGQGGERANVARPTV